MVLQVCPDTSEGMATQPSPGPPSFTLFPGLTSLLGRRGARSRSFSSWSLWGTGHMCTLWTLYSRDGVTKVNIDYVFNRPSVAGGVLKTPSSFIDSIDWLSYPYPPNLQHIINPKLLELWSWNFERMFTPTMCHMSHVRCHVSGGKSCFLCVFSGQSYGASRWRVCNPRVLPPLVKVIIVVIQLSHPI